MKVKDVILKYHKIVPFPWSPSKLRKAGKDAMEFCRQVGQELGDCVDKDTPSAKAVLDTLKVMGVMP